jgi:hypothetical protein
MSIMCREYIRTFLKYVLVDFFPSGCNLQILLASRTGGDQP